MENKNILMTEVRTVESLDTRSIKISIKNKLKFEWTDDDVVENFLPSTSFPSINKNLYDGDKCRFVYSTFNGGKIGTDDEVLEFIENKVRENIEKTMKKIVEEMKN